MVFWRQAAGRIVSLLASPDPPAGTPSTKPGVSLAESLGERSPTVGGSKMSGKGGNGIVREGARGERGGRFKFFLWVRASCLLQQDAVKDMDLWFKHGGGWGGAVGGTRA